MATSNGDCLLHPRKYSLQNATEYACVFAVLLKA